MTHSQPPSIRALSAELKEIAKNPTEGFQVKLVNDEDMFLWEVAMFGPPGTIYQGGYFKARMTFPYDYPYSPPTLKFEKSTPITHPNIAQTGEVPLAMLQRAIPDEKTGNFPHDCWTPAYNAKSVFLALFSLLLEPDTDSPNPANVDASVKYRRWMDTAKTDNPDKEYEVLVKAQVAASFLEAQKDGVIVPTTPEDYEVKAHHSSSTKSSVEIENLYDDDDDDDYLDESNNDDQNSTDESFGGSGAGELEPPDQGTIQNPSDPAGAGSDQEMSLSPRNKNGGVETFEESLSDNDCEKNELGVSKAKKPKVKSKSEP